MNTIRKKRSQCTVDVQEVQLKRYKCFDYGTQLHISNDFHYIRPPCFSEVQDTVLVLKTLNLPSLNNSARYHSIELLPNVYFKLLQTRHCFFSKAQIPFPGLNASNTLPQICTKEHETKLNAIVVTLSDFQTNIRWQTSQSSNEFNSHSKLLAFQRNLNKLPRKSIVLTFPKEWFRFLNTRILKSCNDGRITNEKLIVSYFEKSNSAAQVVTAELEYLNGVFKFYVVFNREQGIANFWDCFDDLMERARNSERLLHFSRSLFEFYLLLNSPNSNSEKCDEANLVSPYQRRDFNLKQKAIKKGHFLFISESPIKLGNIRNEISFEDIPEWIFDTAELLKFNTGSVYSHNQFLNKNSSSLPILSSANPVHYETENLETIAQWDYSLLVKGKFHIEHLIPLQKFEYDGHMLNNKLSFESFCFMLRGGFSTNKSTFWRGKNNLKYFLEIASTFQGVLSTPYPKIDIFKYLKVKVPKFPTEISVETVKEYGKGLKEFKEVQDIKKAPSPDGKAMRGLPTKKRVPNRRDSKLTIRERDTNIFPVNYSLKVVKETGRSFNSFGKRKTHPLPNLVMKANTHHTEEIINSTSNDEHGIWSNFSEILSALRLSEEIKGILPANLKLAIYSKQDSGFIFINALLKESTFVNRGIIKSVPFFGMRGSNAYWTFLIVMHKDFVCWKNAMALILGTHESTSESLWKTLCREGESPHLRILTTNTRGKIPQMKLQKLNCWGYSFHEKVVVEIVVASSSITHHHLMMMLKYRAGDNCFHISHKTLVEFESASWECTRKIVFSTNMNFLDKIGIRDIPQSSMDISGNWMDTQRPLKWESMLPKEALMAELRHITPAWYLNVERTLIINERGTSTRDLRTISTTPIINDGHNATLYCFKFKEASRVETGKTKAGDTTSQISAPLNRHQISKVIKHGIIFPRETINNEKEWDDIFFMWHGLPDTEMWFRLCRATHVRSIHWIPKGIPEMALILAKATRISMSTNLDSALRQSLLALKDRNEEKNSNLRLGLCPAVEFIEESSVPILGVDHQPEDEVTGNDVLHPVPSKEEIDDEFKSKEQIEIDKTLALVTISDRHECREKGTLPDEDQGVPNIEDNVSVVALHVLEFLLCRVEVMGSTNEIYKSKSECVLDELSYLYFRQLFDEKTPADNLCDIQSNDIEADDEVSRKCQNAFNGILSDPSITHQDGGNNSSDLCVLPRYEIVCTEDNGIANHVDDSSTGASITEDSIPDVSQVQDGSKMNSLTTELEFHDSSKDYKFNFVIPTAVVAAELIKELPEQNLCFGSNTDKIKNHEVKSALEDIKVGDEDDLSLAKLEVPISGETKNGASAQTGQINVVYGHETLIVEAAEAGCEGAFKEESHLGSLCEPEGVDLGQNVVPVVQELSDGISDSPQTARVKVNPPESVALDPNTGKDSVSGNSSKRKLPLQRKMRSLSFSSALKFGKSEVATLVEDHLKGIYIPFESVKTQLVRQCRDILLCDYQGNFQKFRDVFLVEAASLLRRLRSQISSITATCRSCEGWPLCYNGRLVIHVGELDEAFLKPGDFYFCLKESADTDVFRPSEGGFRDIYLSFRYRRRHSTNNQEAETTVEEDVIESKIDETRFGSLFTMDWLESTESGLMISDERLTTILQHLLVSVERGIERLEWDSVGKVWQACSASSGQGAHCCRLASTNTKDSSVQTSSPEEEDLTIVSESPDTGDQQILSTCSEGQLPVNLQDGVFAEDATTRPCINGHYENGSLNLDSRRQSRGDDVSVLRLSCATTVPVDEEPDDGYYEHTLTQPTTLSQVDQDLLCSQVALLPGCRDSCGRSIVVVSGSSMKQNSPISPYHLAQLLLYFYTIPKKEIISRGFLVLIDAHDVNEELWNVLDETFCLLEANVTNALSQVLLFSPSVKSSDISKFFPTSRIQCEIVNSYDKLLTFIRKDQLLVTHAGSYVYDHQEWISFRRFLEPFINGCHLSGRNLLNLLEELRGSRLPPSSSLTHQMIEKQKKSVQLTFQDEQLRHLEEEGDTVLKELESYRTRSPHNADYKDNLERTSDLYDKLRKAMAKVSELADKRLQRLEECLQMRTFQEESSQVLSWLCRKGTETLEKHQGVADSLGAIKEQEEEFEKFYFLAMRQIERGNDLLEEASMLPQEHLLPKIREESQTASDDDSGVQELASSLKQHLGSFSEKLEGTRERIEDTAKCYQLMDKSYEWALEAMRFVSQLGLVNAGNPEGIVRQMRCLQEYLEDHLPIGDDAFQEVSDIATKLGNDKLVEQCKVAKLRCQETIDLINARQLTLVKLKQQIEVDSFRGPLWDGDDGTPTPRTSRSNSQPVNMWLPPGSNSSYSLCLGHFRRRSDSTAISSAPQNYGSPIGSYTSFPSSYYPTAKDSYHLDSYVQTQKEDQLLQRGLITDDLTFQGPVASLSRGYLDSRLGHKDGTQSLSSSSSSSCSSSKGPTSVLRSSGRGTYSVTPSGGVNLRWGRKHTRKSQTWQVREETLEKIKNEVREQNALLQVEKCQSPPLLESSDDSTNSNLETDFSPSSETSCKVPHLNTRPDPPRGPVPVNTHLLNQASPDDTPDSSGGSSDPATDAEAKAKKTLMLIMKEMIQTERDYVKSLEYIIENYIPELLREDIPQALRGQRNVVFGNIEKIYEFHSQYFLNELELCEITPFVVGQCFLKYEPQFYLYALYNKNKPKSDALMIEYGNSFFRKKQLELEDKMDLASYLLKPVQRMGKYALLLKQLLKECPEREAEHQDLKISEEMVRFQLRHGNDLLAMDALRDCDVNVKEQGRLLRQDEFLVWQGRSRKCLRHVFLFEDLILFSKARRDPQRKGYEMYQYKQSIKTTDMGLTEQVGDSPTKFEIWFRKRKLNDTYLLQAPNTDVKAAWVHELSKLLWKQALRNREMRLAEMSSMGIGNKPCLDIKPTQDQIRDRSISIHQLTRAPRFRNSIGMPPYDVKSAKRPHSIISVSSSSSSGSSQSSFTFYGTLNLGFEPGDSPPRALTRSLTQQSQCSTESGFCTDQSTVGDSPTESDRIRHKKAERSDSLLSNDSISTSTTPSELNCSPCEEHVIEESITTSM